MRTMVGNECPMCRKALPGAAAVCPHCGHPLREEDAKEETEMVGKVLGNIRLTGLLGEGGMGTVYRAEHTSMGTPYAVKVLHAQMSRDPVVTERFRREAVVCSQLRHPHIVFVTDFGQHDEIGLYLVMEYLDGQTLTDYIKDQEKLTFWNFVHICEQICDGLEAAHDMGIVHRDLKPENVFLVRRSGGRFLVKILDFGIVRIADESKKNLTQAGIALGTPVYMAPEQIRGDEVTTATDIYSLGILFYEMLAGRPPFESEQPFDLLGMHVYEMPEPVSTHRPELKDTEIERVLRSMLAKSPAERPASVIEVHQRLVEGLHELQEKGVEGAFKPITEETRESGAYRAPRSTMRLTGLVRQITQDEPQSRAARLLRHLPSMASLPPVMFFVTVWGVLLRDLIDEPTESDAFKDASRQLARFTEALLKYTDTTQNEDQRYEVKVLLESCLRDLTLLTDRRRQGPIFADMQKLLAHQFFPSSALPSWARPRISGSWGFKDVLTADVRDLLKGTVKAAEAVESAPLAEDSSLIDKLNQDVSLKSLKSVFTHQLIRKKKQ